MDAAIASSAKKYSRRIMSLTPNAISAMFRMNGSKDNPEFSPILQVIHLKKIENKGKGVGDERWKVCYVLNLDVFAIYNILT